MTEQRYDESLKAELTVDDQQVVRRIDHSGEYFASEEATPLQAAVDYLRKVGGTMGISESQLGRAARPASFVQSADETSEYALMEEKQIFDSHTFSFAQMYKNIPVWESAVKVTVKAAPSRVVSAVNTTQGEIEAKLPPKRAMESLKKLIPVDPKDPAAAELADRELPSGAAQAKFLHKALGASAKSGPGEEVSPVDEKARIIRGRFYVYQYDASERIATHEEEEGGDDPLAYPSLPLPPVDKKIKNGQWYVVAELTFSYSTPEHDHMNWRMLLEPETNSVLYLRPLVGCVRGLAYRLDPISATGDATLTSDETNTRLNPHREDVPLSNLDAPVGGQQQLRGAYAKVVNVHSPNISAPTESTGTDFEYDVRTNDFAAVCAYFHTNQVFEVIESLGFPINTYFSNTSFPIQVDHRGMGGVINAHCVGDGMGGISHACYGIMDNTNTAQPLGRACDPRVHWHELCGHGILYESVDRANFRFAHSAGDGLSGIFFDPDSQAPGGRRFEYVPWHPSLRRRFDRDVASGWAWGGARDNGGYGSEEILATSHFRIYQSIGGDSPHRGRRRFASRMALYLILRAIQNLTPASNPRYARDFAEELITIDRLNWTSEGVDGGAYGKVIRWSFEKQGEYQSPLVTRADARFGTITRPGDPPPEDVYIDDGRGGEYQYQHVHWKTEAIWNRRAPDGIDAHQNPVEGATNFAYVKIKNRGTETAEGVVVRGFHSKPSAGLVWPTDLQPLDTPEIAVGEVQGKNLEEKIVGPFKWTPVRNAHGHDCLIMIASSKRDPSNVDNFTSGEVIPEWRLVPNDNNVAQRNVQLVSAIDAKALLLAFERVRLWIGNPTNAVAKMVLEAELPEVLKRKGWKLRFTNLDEPIFVLNPGRQMEVELGLEPGEEFEPKEIALSGEKDINVYAFTKENLVGGMTYRLDPELPDRRNESMLADLAGTEKMLEGLKLSPEKVKSVKVTKLSLDVEFEK